MAEALAEFWHKRIRQELGFAGEDGATVDDLFDQGYRGSRYSFGYPACPNLEDQKQIFDLLDPERIGVEPVRGVPARPRAVHVGDHRPPPRGEVLLRRPGRDQAAGLTSEPRRLPRRRRSMRIALAGRVASLLAAACGAGSAPPLGSPKDLAPVTTPAPGNFRLYVSNQSFDRPTVDIAVFIDGVRIAAREFEVKGQHNWIEFGAELTAGEHKLRAISKIR